MQNLSDIAFIESIGEYLFRKCHMTISKLMRINYISLIELVLVQEKNMIMVVLLRLIRDITYLLYQQVVSR